MGSSSAGSRPMPGSGRHGGRPEQIRALSIEEIRARLSRYYKPSNAILSLAADPRIGGFTTNPTLMWKAGLTDYAEFAQRLLERITEHPISFEVFADEAAEMRRQAMRIAGWGENVYVKIPVSTTTGESK